MKKPQNNFSSLIRQELIDSFADTVKNEIDDFEKTKIETGKSLLNIEKSISILKEDIKNIKTSSDLNIMGIFDHFSNEKQSLKDEFEDQRRYMKTNVLECQKHRKEVDDLIVKFIKKQDCEVLFNELNNKINKSDVNLCKYKEEIKTYIDSKYRECMTRLSTNIDLNVVAFNDINKTFEKQKQDIEEYKVAAEGYTREILILKKELFIMEKKIENLYTLIDRLKGV